MTGFSADWLALREAFDARAREATWPALDLLAHAARWRAARPAQAKLSVIDLACGTGANLRALAPRIGGAQCWRLIDHDTALLASLPRAMAGWAQDNGYRLTVASPKRHAGEEPLLYISGSGFDIELSTERIDLAHDLAGVDCSSAHLVTASALLDLVSAAWLSALVHQASRSGAAMLFALNVDGCTQWNPPHAGDEFVHQLFVQHQQRDKGFGPALGPAAVPYATRLLADAGYTPVQAHSDWVIDGTAGGSGARAMFAAMVEGMAAAAMEQEPGSTHVILEWRARRLAQASLSQLNVGHVDVLGLPSH